MDQWYAIRVSEDTPELISRARLLADKILLLSYVPYSIIRSDAERVRQFEGVPGVLSVQCIDVEQAKVVTGIDTLVAQGKEAAEKLTYNGWHADLEGLQPDETPLYPELDMTANPPEVNMVAPVFLPTRQGWMAALNISQGPIPRQAFRANDPVNVATKVASQVVPVVMAAGNWRISETDTHESLSAWAEASWVISVGATIDEVGTLWPGSSVGSPDDPSRAPTVVAYGVGNAPGIPEASAATSFAAPRVSRILAFMAAYCLTLRHFCQARQHEVMGGDAPEGIPACWVWLYRGLCAS